MQPHLPRQLIDLVLNSTEDWVNWDPERPIKAGDFGTIDKNTGELNIKGNIYENTEIYQDEVEAATRKLVDEYPPITASQGNQYIATSYTYTSGQNLPEGNQYDLVPGFAEASIKGQWSFDVTQRKAVVILARPQRSYIPTNLLGTLAKVQALQDMCLVTQVFLCPAYNFYLSSKDSNGSVALALLGSSHTPGATVGGEVGVEWWSSDTTGLIRNGLKRNGRNDYVPLYTLKEVRKKFHRCRPQDIDEGSYLWPNASTPWDPLDEEGNEDPMIYTDWESDSE